MEDRFEAFRRQMSINHPEEEERRLRSELTQALDNLERQQSEREVLNNRMRAAEEEKKHLQEILAETEKKRIELQLKLEGTSQDLQMARDKIAHLEYDDSAKQIVLLSDEISQLKYKNRYFKKELESCLDEKNDCEEKITTLEYVINQTLKELSVQKDYSSYYYDIINSLSKEKLTDTAESNEDLVSSAKLLKAKEENARLKAQLDAHKNDAKQLKELNEELANSVSLDDIKKHILMLPQNLATNVIPYLGLIIYNPRWQKVQEEIIKVMGDRQLLGVSIANNYGPVNGDVLEQKVAMPAMNPSPTKEIEQK